MSYQYNNLYIVLLSTSLLLAGCHKYQKTTPNLQSIPTQPTNITPNNQFSIQGKIGIKTSTKSGSAFFAWQQDQETFNIELSGALGIGRTNIQGNSHHATLMSTKTGTIEAQSPEQLLEQATGWNAPISYLVPWIQGQSATPKAKIQRDAQNRISQLVEDDWQVDLNYSPTQTLPNKISLKQHLENNQENQITVIINHR